MNETMKERLIITNDLKYLSGVRNFISQLVDQAKVDIDRNKLILAIDEAVTNIIEHGYDPGTHGKIEIEIEILSDKFITTIRDEGRFFNPSSKADANVLNHVKYGKKKGLGIFIIRQVMDEIRYKHKEGSFNELILVKNLPKKA